MAKTLYTLEVILLDGYMTEEFAKANPVISRTIEIRADQTLNQLHRAIFEAFDRWDDCHLSEFHLGQRPRDYLRRAGSLAARVAGRTAGPPE